MMYKKLKTPSGTEDNNTIQRVEDGACIPFDSANTDYQAYLKWVEDGGVPLPADE